jgi:hypothetical protein
MTVSYDGRFQECRDSCFKDGVCVNRSSGEWMSSQKFFIFSQKSNVSPEIFLTLDLSLTLRRVVMTGTEQDSFTLATKLIIKWRTLPMQGYLYSMLTSNL